MTRTALVGGLLAVLCGVATAQYPNRTLPVHTCIDVTGAVPIFMASGTCSDQTESKVAQPFREPGVLTKLECRGTTAFVGTITITGRSGTCGALVNRPFTCVLTGTGSGAPRCDSGNAQLEVTAAGGCWSLGLTFGGPLSIPTGISCTIIRAI